MDVQGTAGWHSLPYKSGHSGTGIKEQRLSCQFPQ